MKKHLLWLSFLLVLCLLLFTASCSGDRGTESDNVTATQTENHSKSSIATTNTPTPIPEMVAPTKHSSMEIDYSRSLAVAPGQRNVVVMGKEGAVTFDGIVKEYPTGPSGFGCYAYQDPRSHQSTPIQLTLDQSMVAMILVDGPYDLPPDYYFPATGLPLPFHFYSDYAYFDVWNILDDSTLTKSIVNTAGVLLEQGEITYEEHYKIMVELVDPQPVIDMSIEEVEAFISEKGWFDRETNRFISDYKQDAKEICYVILFSQGVDGLVLYFEFYREGDTEPAGFSSVPTSGLSSVVMIFDDFEGYPSDRYRILVTLADGSVVADESVTLGATREQKGL